MAGRFLNLFKILRRKKKRSPEAAPAQQPEKLEQFQPPQDDAALDKTQEQEPGRGCFCKTLKRFRKFLRIQRRETGNTAAQGTAQRDSKPTKFQAKAHASPESTADSGNNAVNNQRVKAVHRAVTESMTIRNTDTRMTQGITNTGTTPTLTGIHAPSKDFFESVVSLQHQVPAMVRSIHQRLVSFDTVDARLQSDIVRLAEEYPADVVLTLLRCAPTCDRAATMMWRAIGSSRPAVEKVLPALLCVMEDWPLHSTCTSDGDDRDVFALAATLVLWVIVQVPECHEAMTLYSSRLFVALLFHVVITTQQMPPEEVDNFWGDCRMEHCVPNKLNRFAVQAMKALLCRLHCDNEVMAVERKRGWKMLLCAHTQHFAVALLAREMRRNLVPLCSRIALHLLRQLSRKDPYWDLPALAFLVEVLECLDLTQCGGSVLRVLARHLYSMCREQRRLALRGLVVLSKDLLMARRMCCLSPILLDLLEDADEEVISMSLSVFTNVFLHKDIFVSSTTAPKLAETLLLLFNHDNSYVQVLSIQLFSKVIELVVYEGKNLLKAFVNESLCPLSFYCHDVNWHVAEASWETLHSAARFLKRRDIEQMLQVDQTWRFGEGLLAEDRRRAAEHLRQALPYLRSPQKPLQEAAVRHGRAPMMKRQQQGLQDLSQGLESPRTMPAHPALTLKVMLN